MCVSDMCVWCVHVCMQVYCSMHSHVPVQYVKTKFMLFVY